VSKRCKRVAAEQIYGVLSEAQRLEEKKQLRGVMGGRFDLSDVYEVCGLKDAKEGWPELWINA
jgi:hypothetical protein